MRWLIAVLILMAVGSFGGAFWLVFEGAARNTGRAVQESAAQAAKPEADQAAKPQTDPATGSGQDMARAPTAEATATSATATSASTAPNPAIARAEKPATAAPAVGRSPGATVLASTAAPAPRAAGPDPLAALTVRPSPFPLALPIDCSPGRDCWVINHVDLDSGPGRRDYRCGNMSYDGHKGTDIALRNLARLADDVPVLAAAPGRVVGVRDGMADVSIAVAGRDAVKDKECGNGVRVEHDGGWTTQYCHLKRDSIAVHNGQAVRTGQRLGSVGLSGMTEFPHVHMTVEKDRDVVDPFRGIDGGPECGRGIVPLWDADARRQLVDHAPILLDAGFATGPVERTAAEAGTAAVARASTDAAALVVWARAAGIEPGDTLATTITGPDGTELFSDRWTADNTRIVQFRYVGKKRPGGGWPAGGYTGRVVLERAGQAPREQTLTLRVGS